jgi:hypothetical protein
LISLVFLVIKRVGQIRIGILGVFRRRGHE